MCILQSNKHCGVSVVMAVRIKPLITSVMPAYLVTSMFVLTLVSATRPMVDQSGGGRFGKVVAPPEPKKEAVPVPRADEEVHETSLEEEVDEVPVETKGKPARSWDTRVREISGKLLNRFNLDFGSTTSSVAKALGRASAAVQGIPFPGTTFFSTVLAVVIGSSPIARTVGDGIGSVVADVVRGVMSMVTGSGGPQEDEPFDKDYPVFYQSRYKRDIVDESVIQDFMHFVSELAGYALDMVEEKLL
ncbi:uncharacterized protein LOC135205310 isoform X2 [Macrobrachium nipponense]|uniref:uncharacterized protein LOC135205310 isoform X2 n=1 Tax=Macrobrachium nipponense TaxID=159736 RepID=UPI0030C84712